MKPEMDKAMSEFVHTFGSNYRTEQDARFEEVYWTLGKGADYVEITVKYDEAEEGLRYEINSEILSHESKTFHTSKEMIRDLKSYVRQEAAGQYLTPNEKIFVSKIKSM
jgi:hypothetical protein